MTKPIQQHDTDGRLLKKCKDCGKAIWDNTGIGLRTGVAYGVKEFFTDWCDCPKLSTNVGGQVK